MDKIEEDGADDDNADRSGKPRTTDSPGDPNVRSGAGEKTLNQELPILVGDNRVARIPFPMTEDDFDLLLGTLNLWKKKLLSAKPNLDAKGETE